MRTSWHDIWGSARGPINRLTPQARIVCGGCVFATCMAAPVTTWQGIVFVAGSVVLWDLLVWPPSRVARSTVALGLVLFLPYLLLAVIIRGEDGTAGWLEAFAAPWTVFFRGMAAMQASVSTATTLSASALRQGLGRLPVPEVLSAVLIQIVHQTSMLIYETRRVSAAVAVRGGAVRFRDTIEMMAALPRVWLVRVVERAERVGHAMEVRGYCQRDATEGGAAAVSLADLAAIAAALLVLVAGIALRLRGGS